MPTRFIRVTLALIVTCAAGVACDGRFTAEREAARTTVSVDTQLRAELIAARQAIWTAWFANDAETLTAMLPPEFVGIGFGGGAFDTRESALKGAADFASGGGRLTRLEFRDDRIQRFGDVATMFSNYTIEFEAGGTTTLQSGRATEVFVRRGGRWVNPAWHLDSGR